MVACIGVGILADSFLKNQNMAQQKFKKKEVYKETFKKGVFETNRKKVSDWVLDDTVWLEVVNAGKNEDESEFVTIKINNITKFPVKKNDIVDQPFRRRF